MSRDSEIEVKLIAPALNREQRQRISAALSKTLLRELAGLEIAVQEREGLRPGHHLDGIVVAIPQEL